MFKGIRGRLIWTYIFIVLSAILLLEGFLVEWVWRYYTGNIREIMVQQAQLANNFFKNYIEDANLIYVAQDLSEDFAQVSNTEVQVMNTSGIVLGDSIGNFEYAESEDIQDAINGNIGVYQGKYMDTNEDVMAVSSPLMKGNRVVGVIRFVTSLEGVEEVMRRIIINLIEIGAAIVAIVVIVGIWVSWTLTKPLDEITRAAKEISAGDFKVRVSKRFNDEIGTLAETLNQAAVELEKLDTMKNDFISSVSHEIRTPLTSIKGWVVTLKEGSDEEIMKKGLDIIEKETDRLTVMVNKLLDFSKLESGRISLNMGPVDLKELIISTVDQIRPRAERLGIRLDVDLDDLPMIEGDASRLRQVLINILDNSLKFTDSGGEIGIYAEKSQDIARIVVQDTGCGIPEGDLNHITEKFYTAKAKASGSGLGLAISKEIIELHGGKINIKSRVGEGTSVMIELPA
ncbi:sensor histidine kinase [Calorimonas adulescens]|uniref:histidine kinase n=1 Tax=Calorimonas adulescens TaxID=2606906 RepID=A0A5D8QAH0_9THEO|nr:ATP-binding protein [Calorimonas adulescens]TZE81129.1 HAMP domain-containing protein [Calorimonas adulescens]